MEIPKELYNEALDIARLILSEDAKEKIKGYELDADFNLLLTRLTLLQYIWNYYKK